MRKAFGKMWAFLIWCVEKIFRVTERYANIFSLSSFHTQQPASKRVLTKIREEENEKKSSLISLSLSSLKKSRGFYSSSSSSSSSLMSSMTSAWWCCWWWSWRCFSSSVSLMTSFSCSSFSRGRVGLRRRIKAPVRKGASSNLVDIIMFSFFCTHD